MSSSEREKMYLPMYMACVLLYFVNLYWFGYGFFKDIGFTHQVLNDMFVKISRSGFFENSYKTRLVTALFVFLTCIIKAGGSTKASWLDIGLILGSGLVCYFFPFIRPDLYVFLCTAGFVLMLIGFSMLGRKTRGAKLEENDANETFEQCGELILTEYSINIETRYQWKKKIHRGWINVVNPFRATMILGTPGSGKSYSVFWSYIEQMVAKQYALLVYDYKLPDLTKIVYNEYLINADKYRKKYGKDVKFCIINFDNPRQSMRCNPLNAKYLTDMSDAHEIADLIMKNVNPKSIENEDFFVMSAKIFIASLVWFLKTYKNGRYCSFPHLIELMGANYMATFDMMKQVPELTVMIQPFADALKGGAQEQLQGQIASARMPLLKFPSAILYWVLSGDDFTLDLNNPDEPKILCLGNNPDRQSVYGTTLALYTSRIIKKINHPTTVCEDGQVKRNLPCGVILDEFPTVFIKGIDNLIATARSNRVAVVLGAQDKSQIKRDYGTNESEVVFNTVGTMICGQVNGDTAKHMSETFGREFREQQSQTTGGDHDTINKSFHQLDILPQSKIETLTQGYFFGKVADDNVNPIKKKLFCGEIKVDVEARKRKQDKWKPLPDFGTKWFHDEEIRESIMSDKNRDMYIIDSLKEEIELEENDPTLHKPGYVPMSSISCRMMAEQRLEEMDDDKKKEMLERIVRKRQDADMNRVLMENYRSIKTDVLEMFKAYNIDLSSYEKDVKTPQTNITRTVDTSDEQEL